MNRLLCIVSLYLFVILPVYSEDILRVSDIRSVSLGGSGVSQSVLFNPAVLSLTRQRELSTSYYNYFLMKGISTLSASFQYPNRVLDAGVTMASSGDKAYRESLLTLSVGKLLNTRWTTGLSISYRFISSQFINETPGRLTAGLGITYKSADNVLLGFSALNLPFLTVNNPAKISITNYYCLRGGIAWQFINSLLLTTEVENNVESPITVHLGIEYKPFDSFRIRMGIRTEPFLPSAGIGYTYSVFTLDGAVTYHPVLGVSAGAGLKAVF